MNSDLLSLAPTAIMKIYEATCLDLIRGLSKDLAEDKPTMESFTSINGVDKCVQEINFTQPISELYKKYHNPKISLSNSEDANSTYSWKTFNSKIEISKIGNHDMSINESMEIAGKLRKDIGDQFYGMLLSTKGNKKSRVIFNPLHPIIVAELLKEETSIDKDKKQWSIAIYTWKVKDEFQKKYPLLYKKTDYIPEIANIIASINTPSQYVIENKDFNVDIVDDKFVLNFAEIKRRRDDNEIIEEESNGSRNYLIPGQIINISGVAYPYYNVVYSRRGLAWNMSPMYGANISHPYNQSTRNEMEGGSRICTHSGNSKTQMGVSSLNHCNTTSPLNQSLMNEGSMTYAGQCVEASLEMFLGEAYNIPDTTPEKALTFQEFKDENGGNGTKADFLKYIKNRLETVMESEKNGEAKALVPDTLEPPTETIVADYPIHNPELTYAEGNIVRDTAWIENDPLGQLRIMRNGRWENYIPPIDLNDIEINDFDTVPLTAEELELRADMQREQVTA